jgi:hypothetical protein
MRTRLIGAVLLMLTFVACASTGGSAGGAASVSSSVGTAPRAELDNTVRVILTRNLYVLERELLETNMLYETRWRVRQPFDDERALGATSAESRIIVRARPRSREANIYAVTIVVENRLRMEDGEWAELPATSEFSAYARSIASELSRELAQGIRVR